MLTNQIMGNQCGLLDDARRSAGQYLGAGRDALARGYADGVRSLESGNQQAGTMLGWVPGLYDRLMNMNTDATGYDWQGNVQRSRGALDDAMGMNGADGRARVQQNFQTGPGFQFAVDTATDAAARAAAKVGRANSGNTLSAVTALGNNLANQEWGNYLNRLQGINQMDSGIASGMSMGDANRRMAMAGQATAGLAGAYGQMANQAYGYGRDQANMGSQFARDQYGSLAGEAGLDLGVAGQKNSIWDNFLNKNLEGAQASIQGSNADDAGRMGLGLGIANLGLQALGGMGGFGGMGGLFRGMSGGVGRGTSGFF